MASLTKQFRFLDNLRESGRVNMWGASLYLRPAFGLTEQEARDVCGKWMDTFDGVSSPEDRAARAEASQ